MSSVIVSDSTRSNVSIAVSVVVTAVAMLIISALSDWLPEGRIGVVLAIYVISWPVFTVTYLVWTHLAYAASGPERLRATAVHEHRRRRGSLMRRLNSDGAADWSVIAAIIAVAIAVMIAVNPAVRDSVAFIVLGLLCVACSWSVMIYSFALDYMRLNLTDEQSETPNAHVRFPFSDEPRFGDYVTFAVLMSTMAAVSSGRVSSRPAWRLVRTNVVLAFVFNTVIVAMTVSLLFGGLGA
ncbi:MAG TPA: DUF1345 domain-containing protein [Candidatus Nesterenkonia stercoripullorum]|uniref:DUF1345 domain-containing protein n=1 Tax=Candidatus Nesterenkonia stercoripullorum TaxID=2838701 RepID=A0A9D1S1Y3_9MICC|nr:DUF1345 domain-containing protein [Candidatus Nesterenkonia stercoripullorum]